MKYVVLLIAFVSVFACNTQSEKAKEIENIPMEVKLIRFDEEFAKTTASNLPELKNKYPQFFPKQYHDSIWLQKIEDTLQQQLNEEVAKAFPDNELLEEELSSLFQHIKYYFPEFKAPTVATVTSFVDYDNQVILADTLLVIALDTYLGEKHPFYESISGYIAKNLTPSQIMPDVASAYAEQLIAAPRERSLLAPMIYFGKELYLKDLWMPDATDAQKIGYTEEEMQWVKENEAEMWRYFIEKELLYDTDPKLAARFIYPAPFSKFYLEIDNDSPGMVGRYLGWQIVRTYMERNDVSVKQLMIAPTEEVYTNSKYKPKK